ncbi:hypothetical protein B4143_4369 [Bacillus subtilis]|nr:hypothetical protein B4143_4369 [Bacillus subtilis]MBO3634457.1 type II toxin-antitoxin system PemK/MazF family toxin [Bacillus subtilis]NMP48132.1 type II toxin-antitoxin system PemK/MazF family toxin [Bacillus subtilis]TVX87661.1 type II toxin-antitoxin system PemK/MazF family toxin [Bacillus subtilis]
MVKLSENQLVITKHQKLEEWNIRKKELAKNWIENKQSLRGRGIVQGGIYLCELGENLGSEQNSNIGEDRPVIVLSNNTINSTGENIIVAPLSKTLKFRKGTNIPKYRSHYFLFTKKYSFLTYDSAIKAEEMKAVSKVRLNKKLGEISKEDFKRIITRVNWTIS